MVHETDYLYLVLFLENVMVSFTFLNKNLFFHSAKVRADQYESRDHKLNTILMNHSCVIPTQSTRVICCACCFGGWSKFIHSTAHSCALSHDSR
jgi:hypothetical protein